MTVFRTALPLLTVAGGAVLVLLLDAFWKRESKTHLASLSLLIIVAAGALYVSLWNADAADFGGMLRLDRPALLYSLILLAAGAFAVLLGLRYIVRQDAAFGEYYGLLLLSLSGLLIMVASNDLLVIVLGLEVFSISAYALTGLRRNDDAAAEAAAKYFLMGGFAAAFMIFGLACLFGAAGSLDLGGIAAASAAGAAQGLLLAVGWGLILVGLVFKIGLVPFHMWQPDVYQGAPTPISAFFAVAPKTASLLVLLRIIGPWTGKTWIGNPFFIGLYGVAVLTMIVGNLGALRQRNLKRLFAYSSIAHAGILLIAVLAADAAGLTFYLINYFFLGLGAFAALAAMTGPGREYVEIDDFAGIGFRYPWIGAILSVLLLSLAGFPPLGGFLAKFYVFSAAVRAGLTPLVIVGVLTSLVSVYYYLRIIVAMYMREPEHPVDIDVENPAVLLVLFLCLYGVLQLGLFPGNILHIIRQATAGIF